MPRVDTGAAVLQVPALYRRLLEDERGRCQRPDPRLLFGTTAEDPKVFRRSTHLLDALEAGEPVAVPAWRLGGQSIPAERLREMRRCDRSITGWIVHSDDTAAPVRDSRS